MFVYIGVVGSWILGYMLVVKCSVELECGDVYDVVFIVLVLLVYEVAVVLVISVIYS